MYAIKKTGTNKYVALRGRKHSYTTSLKYAQRFHTREDAERNCCPENERIVFIR